MRLNQPNSVDNVSHVLLRKKRPFCNLIEGFFQRLKNTIKKNTVETLDKGLFENLAEISWLLIL